jgi:hypothetical protein
VHALLHALHALLHAVHALLHALHAHVHLKLQLFEAPRDLAYAVLGGGNFGKLLKNLSQS